ncbi:hypothetical protein CFN78_17870 [Amycolatopsis antarctica]|uniref:DUF3558 domain-containing protein n=1 Tax=Amycolatopsis antarctica TaxID=1854586 RepID=A0A263D0P2_9PSEU|nr:hypothetical protein [Amycolatopsis antarctica]OZM72002.1 hypothetical protein CFN78_17870 [Amycolatopsis antarctica]
MRRALTAVALAAATLTVAQGCAESEDRVTEPTPVSLPAQLSAAPQARPMGAVVAGLTGLDACALIDPAAASIPGYEGSRVRARSPHQCTISTGDGQGKYGDMAVTLGLPLSRDERFRYELAHPAGITTYTRTLDSMSCEAYVPVGADLSIAFSIRSTGAEPDRSACEQALALVTAAAPRLTAPSGPPGPFAAHDACTVLGAALGDARGDAPLSPGGHSARSGIDGCGVDEGRGLEDRTSLELSYRPSERERDGDDGEPRTVGGRQVWPRYDDCAVVWDHAASGLPGASGESASLLEIVLEAPCGQTDALAAEVMLVLDGPPPERPGAQSPLFYRAEEPDVALGACVDVPARESCEPHMPVPAPRGAREVSDAVRADPDVACAIAAEAVGRHLGPELRPVVTRRPVDGCLFVEPRHSVRVRVGVSVGELDDTSTTSAGQARTTVAGRPAVTQTSEGGAGYRIAVQLVEDEEAPTRLDMSVEVTPPRGSGGRNSGGSRAPALDAIAEDIAARVY